MPTVSCLRAYKYWGGGVRPLSPALCHPFVMWEVGRVLGMEPAVMPLKRLPLS